MKSVSPTCYTLTPTGYTYIRQWLDYNPEPQIKLCLDFSERDFHIGGVLGKKILAKLVSEGKCQLTENRVVKLTTTDMTNLI
ncbi:transcriptional regulator [Enterococcus faecium]|uniref:transcriptional regulator n=1 Tax=Enterococcus faecium TaxID=1352 RepID=UPI00351EF230